MIIFDQILSILYWIILFSALALIIKFVNENRGNTKEEVLHNLGNYAKVKLLLIIAFILVIILKNWIYNFY